MFKNLFDKMVDFVLSFSRAGYLVTNAKIPAINDHVVIVSSSLDHWHKIIINDCLSRNKDVYLITNDFLGDDDKNVVANWSLVENKNSHKYDDWAFVAKSLTYIGIFLVILSWIYTYLYKVEGNWDIIIIFFPLLVAFIGVYFWEFISNKRIYKASNNPKFHLILQKNKTLPKTGQFLFIDNQTLYVIVKEENSEFFRVNNAIMVNEFVDCLNQQLDHQLSDMALKNWILK